MVADRDDAIKKLMAKLNELGHPMNDIIVSPRKVSEVSPAVTGAGSPTAADGDGEVLMISILLF